MTSVPCQAASWSGDMPLPCAMRNAIVDDELPCGHQALLLHNSNATATDGINSRL